MFNRSLTIGRFLGIRLAVSPSWLVIFLLVTATLGTTYFPGLHPAWPRPLHWAAAIGASLLFFGCVLAHELAHSLTALRNRVPVRSITLFMFGGVSHIGRDAATPGAELRIALAGPLVSLVLGALAGGLFALFQHDHELLGATLFWLAGVNLSLALFNLLPGLPLDGGRAFRAVVWYASDDFTWATGIATRVGQYSAALLGLIGVYLALMTQGGFANAIWLLLIAWFLFTAAAGSYQSSLLMKPLAGLSVRDVMRSDPPTVDADSLVTALREDLPLGHLPPTVVLRAGRPVGILDGALHRRNTLSERPVRVEHLVSFLDRYQALSSDLTAAHAFQTLLEGDRTALPVVDGDRVVGVVVLDDLLPLAEGRRRGLHE